MMRVAASFTIVLACLASFGWYAFQPEVGPANATNPRPSAVFAADRAGTSFDGLRAMSYLEDLCKIGPRISGSAGMKKQQEWLEKYFAGLGGRVASQRFTAQQKSQRQPVEMANLIVSWHPDQKRRLLFCSHYDTRPIADQEPNPRRWREPFLSANDGGSGVALLMELGRHVPDLKTAVGIDFAFFDGEEYIFDPAGDKYFFGSEHFGQEYRKHRPPHRYLAAVLLDMVGGKDARFPIEQNSWFKASNLVQELWRTAAELKCGAFVNELGQQVRDDHLALNQAGIPAVDIIDFNYPHWHRLSDLPANCSGETLTQVARVLAVWSQSVK